MAYGGGGFLIQNKRLPGSYINFVSGNSSDKSSSKGKGTIAPFTMSIDKDGNLYVTFNKSMNISFELDDSGDLYASYDESGISLELDGSGNLYVLEE